MCTTECTVDILENWTSPGGIDCQLVSETQKGQSNIAAVDLSNFAQLGKELEEWVQSQLSESQLNDSVSVEPTDEHQEDSAGVDRKGKTDEKSKAKVLHSWVYDEQQLGGRTLASFRVQLSRKWIEGWHRNFRRLQSCCWRTDYWAGSSGRSIFRFFLNLSDFMVPREDVCQRQ